MSLIPCDYDCIYQDEGYCKLNTPATITNNLEKDCVHYIKLNPNNESQTSNEYTPISHSSPSVKLNQYF